MIRATLGLRPKLPRLSARRMPSAKGHNLSLDNLIIKHEGGVAFDWLAGKRAAAVVGPPGTGKTSAILRLASSGEFACCGAEISLELKPEVLYLAFNRSAAEDAEARAGEAPLRAVTIHAAGARALAANMGLKVGEVLLNLRREPGGRVCGQYELCAGGVGASASRRASRPCAAVSRRDTG